jgi:hypothetical protein
MVDFQCVGFGVEGEPGAKTTKGRGGDGAYISEEGVARWREGESATRLQPLGGDDTREVRDDLVGSSGPYGWMNEMHYKL